MNSAIEQMLQTYQVENIYDQKNAMKEIMQEIVLCGLSTAYICSRGSSTPVISQKIQRAPWMK